jgi:hypothetical protein
MVIVKISVERTKKINIPKIAVIVNRTPRMIAQVGINLRVRMIKPGVGARNFVFRKRRVYRIEEMYAVLSH